VCLCVCVCVCVCVRDMYSMKLSCILNCNLNCICRNFKWTVPGPSGQCASSSRKQKTQKSPSRNLGGRSPSITRGPSKLAKQPNNHKTVAHIINPGKITRFVHATDLAWHAARNNQSGPFKVECEFTSLYFEIVQVASWAEKVICKSCVD